MIALPMLFLCLLFLRVFEVGGFLAFGLSLGTFFSGIAIEKWYLNRKGVELEEGTPVKAICEALIGSPPVIPRKPQSQIEEVKDS